MAIKKPKQVGKLMMTAATRAPVRTARPPRVSKSSAVTRPVVRRTAAAGAAAKPRVAAAARGATARSNLANPRGLRVTAMAAQNPTIAPGETNPNGPDPKPPPEDRVRPSKAAIKRVRQNAKKNGKTLTKEQAINKAARQTKIDKEGGGAQRFDFAGDGAYTKDKDFGTKKNNERRAKMGKERANVKGAPKYGTGKKLKKPSGNGGNGGNGNGNGNNGNGNNNDAGSGDPFPNGQQDGNPNGQQPATDLSPQQDAARAAGPAGSPGHTKYEKEQARLARRRRRNK